MDAGTAVATPVARQRKKSRTAERVPSLLFAKGSDDEGAQWLQLAGATRLKALADNFVMGYAATVGSTSRRAARFGRSHNGA
jgi:hypothetical protein